MHSYRSLRDVRALIAAATTGFLFCLVACSGASSNPASTLAATQIALSVSQATLNFGGSATFTATLSGGSSTPAPIGTITFFDGTTQLQAAVISGQTATATVTTFAVGAHSITATYGGDQTHAASTSAATSVSVFFPTSTTITATPSLAGVGDMVTLSAAVKGGAGTPTGTVTFSSGSTSLGSASLNTVMGVQTATVLTTALPLGMDPIIATYAASGFALGSVSAPVTVQIHATLIPTSSSVVATPSATVTVGTVVTLTDTIVPASGTAMATGTVTFLNGTRTLGAAALTGSSNVVSFQTKQFDLGTNTITAVYSGDAVYATSTTPSITLTLTPVVIPMYTNPLNMNDAVTGKVYNCPDPAILKTTTGAQNTWYAYCTGDAFNAADTVGGGGLKVHLISVFSSTDLVNWKYLHDALTSLPGWAQPGQEPQAPAVKLIGNSYVLYYETPSNTAPNGPAVAVATASTPDGPFVDSGTPLVDQSLLFNGGPSRTKNSPEVVADNKTGQLWLVYGGIYGGLTIRQLNAQGTALSTATELSIAVDNYYTNPFIFYKNGFYYEFVTAGACCSGPYSTYNVHVGRSNFITGPYNDAEGNDLNAYSTLASRGAPGGDPALVMTGNDIVGAGSNSVFTDESGQDYIFYSGVSRKQPYLPGVNGYTARQLMMDALDFVNGWPSARSGAGPSDFTQPQPFPAAQPGTMSAYVAPVYTPDSPGTPIAPASDDFNTSTLSNQWTFLHTPASYTLSGTAYVVQSVSQESVVASSMPNLPILAEPEPAGNYLLEVKLSSSAGPNTFYTDGNQGGIFIYSNDALYLRLDQFVYFDTKQIEYLNQYGPGIPLFNFAFAPVGTPNYYASTYLRIAKRVGTNGAPDTYTSYSSTDGITYLKGPAWTTTYPPGAKIGLFAGHTSGYTASFDYVHVTTLLP